ncbi:MAG: hypothetical protein M1309_06755 [Actinobacteria bacterium]|nr:hypothetical protein [Actinomycetota bacterium]
MKEFLYSFCLSHTHGRIFIFPKNLQGFAKQKSREIQMASMLLPFGFPGAIPDSVWRSERRKLPSRPHIDS